MNRADRLQATKQSLSEALARVEQQRAAVVRLEVFDFQERANAARDLLHIMRNRVEAIRARYQSMLTTERLVNETREIVRRRKSQV